MRACMDDVEAPWEPCNTMPDERVGSSFGGEYAPCHEASRNMIHHASRVAAARRVTSHDVTSRHTASRHTVGRVEARAAAMGGVGVGEHFGARPCVHYSFCTCTLASYMAWWVRRSAPRSVRQLTRASTTATTSELPRAIGAITTSARLAPFCKCRCCNFREAAVLEWRGNGGSVSGPSSGGARRAARRPPRPTLQSRSHGK